MTTSFTGTRGVTTFQAIALKHGLVLYAKTGMRPNRAWTPSAMLAAAGRITGHTYKRGNYAGAVVDLERWIAEHGAAHGEM